MSLKRNQLNPLNVLGLRKLNFIPEHFSTISVIDPGFYDIRNVDAWIEINLNNRYAIKQTFSVNPETRKLTKGLNIGFEDPKELTMFSLGCTDFHKMKG